MRIQYIALFLLLGCNPHDCKGRHAQWVTRPECEAFCQHHGGVDLHTRDGECYCEESYSVTDYRKRRLEQLRRDIRQLEAETEAAE